MEDCGKKDEKFIDTSKAKKNFDCSLLYYWYFVENDKQYTEFIFFSSNDYHHERKSEFLRVRIWDNDDTEIADTNAIGLLRSLPSSLVLQLSKLTMSQETI